MRTFLTLIFSLAGLSLAHAHAFLDHADPKVGSTVHAAPARVTVWMTEDLEPAFSKLQVFDSKGAEVDKKDVQVSAATMSVAVPALPPGTYKVVWHAVAVDTHHTMGDFTFQVAP